MTSRIPLLATVLLVLVVGVAATACGADSLHSAMGHDSSDMSHNDMMGGSASGAMTHSAAAMGTGHTADVMFTQQMIPHHQQAVDMANLALDPAHEASPAVKNLATRIKTAQTGEIVEMKAWLQAWGVDPVSSEADHMPMGMMSSAEMAALENARGTAFDRRWLEGMITHHDGALMMASHIAARGVDPRVLTLTTAIEQSQTAQITEMKHLLGQ